MVKNILKIASLYLWFTFSSSFVAAREGQGEVEVCPISALPPQSSEKPEPDPRKEVTDQDRELKDLSTSLVVEQFFTTEETLFNFMKLVYGTIDSAIGKYRQDLGVEEKAIFLLFKGGNVLRMVANEVFDQLPKRARQLLAEYLQYFKRSDADFSVYIDETKIQGHDFEEVFNAVADLIFEQLNHIRDEIDKAPERYFDFFRLSSRDANKVMKDYLAKLNASEATKDEQNSKWFEVRFEQYQLRDAKAPGEKSCPYQGHYDFRYTTPAGTHIIKTERLTKKPDWIVNSDNRTIKFFPSPEDNSKVVRFALVRSKVSPEVFYIKDGDMHKKAIGGELVDVTVIHKEDFGLRAFLDLYDRAVRDYALIAEDGERLRIKAYSPYYLAKDLRDMIFESPRPWKGDPKYIKRVNRLLFLHLVEMLRAYGSGSPSMRNYIDRIRAVLEPLREFDPSARGAEAKAREIKEGVDDLRASFKEMSTANDFFAKLAQLTEGMVENPEDEDREGLDGLLDIIDRNLDIAEQLTEIRPAMKIDPREFYKVEIDNLL